MSNRKQISRRQFLKRTALGAGAIALSACGAAPEAPAAVGSGSAPGAASAAASSAPASSAAAVSAGTPVELVWWDGWTTQEPWILNEIKLFQEANPGITVKRIKQPKIDDALKAAFQDKSLPDLWPNGGADLKKQVAEGWLTPISDFPDYQEFVNSFPRPKVDFVNGSNILGGKTYGAPFEARGGMWNLLYVNTRVFKDAGIVDDKGEAKVPQTLDEMIDACRQIKDKSGGQVFGFASPFSEFLGAFFPWWWGVRSGAPFDGSDPKTGKSIYGQNKVFNRILEFVALGRDEGWIHPQSASGNDESIRALFAEGEVGIIPGGSWNMNGWKDTHPDFKEYRPFPPPLIETEQQRGWYDAGHGGNFLAISSSTRQTEAAWKLFKWLQSKEASRRWVESGNGSSLWPENNDPRLMGSPQQQEYFQLNTAQSRVAPYKTEPNPDMDKVAFPASKPDEVAILQGVFSGQISDVDAALKELGAAKDQAREQGFADAKKAGATNVGFEYLALGVQFPNYDPSSGKDFEPSS
jgi:ABC-type glycerol-3-phosphate transport system substrate-binding protein